MVSRLPEIAEMNRFEKECKAIAQGSSYLPIYCGRVDIGERIVGFVQLTKKPIFRHLRVVSSGGLVSILLRTTVIPTGNQWRQMFVDTHAAGEAQYFDLRLRSDRDSALQLARSVIESPADDTLATTVLTSTLAGRQLADSTIGQNPSFEQNEREQTLADLESQMSGEELEFSRSIRRSSLLSFPKESSADETRELESYKIATHMLTPQLMNAPAIESDPHKNCDVAFAIQILASRAFEPLAWK